MKIIIRYDGVSDIDALMYVRQVVKKGRISNNNTQYCYCTMFNDAAEVYADRTKSGTDTFGVIKAKKPLPDDEMKND